METPASLMHVPPGDNTLSEADMGAITSQLAVERLPVCSFGHLNTHTKQTRMGLERRTN